MKRSFTCMALLACMGFFASCSKDVKAPDTPRTTNSANATNNASGGSQSGNQSGQYIDGCGDMVGYNGTTSGSGY